MLNFIKQNKLIVIFIIAYIIILGYVSCLRHYTFQTQTYDMAIFEQSFFQTFQGNYLYNSIEGNNHLAVHWSPFLILLIPFYAIFSSAYFLLIVQTLALALGGLAIYLLTKNLLNKKIAIFVSLAYLLYPSLHNVNLFDFHAIAFFIPLMLWFFYFWQQEKIWPATIFLFLATTTKENAILAVLFTGVYLLIFSRKKIYGGVVAIVSGIYFFLTAKVFMPGLGGGVGRVDQYAHLGNSVADAVKNIFTTSIFFKTVFIKAKLVYLFKLFFPVGFLSLLAPSFLILLIPGLAQNLLTQRPSQFSTLYQYDALLIPFIFVALIYAIKKLKTKKGKWLQSTLWLLIITSIISFGWFSMLSPFKTDYQTYKKTETIQGLHQVMDEIPDNYAVAAHINLVPHLTHRAEVYVNGYEPYLMDYVLIIGNSITPEPNLEVFYNYLNQYAATENYDILKLGEGIMVIKIKEPWTERPASDFQLTPIY